MQDQKAMAHAFADLIWDLVVEGVMMKGLSLLSKNTK